MRRKNFEVGNLVQAHSQLDQPERLVLSKSPPMRSGMFDRKFAGFLAPGPALVVDVDRSDFAKSHPLNEQVEVVDSAGKRGWIEAHCLEAVS